MGGYAISLHLGRYGQKWYTIPRRPPLGYFVIPKKKHRSEYATPVIDIASPDGNEDGRSPPAKRERAEDDNGKAKSARGTKEIADIENANSQREAPQYQRK